MLTNNIIERFKFKANNNENLEKVFSLRKSCKNLGYTCLIEMSQLLISCEEAAEHNNFEK